MNKSNLIIMGQLRLSRNGATMLQCKTWDTQMHKKKVAIIVKEVAILLNMDTEELTKLVKTLPESFIQKGSQDQTTDNPKKETTKTTELPTLERALSVWKCPQCSNEYTLNFQDIVDIGHPICHYIVSDMIALIINGKRYPIE